MPQLNATITYAEREPVPTATVRAYFQNHATIAGRYVLGDAAEDATAWLAESGGVHHLDDSSVAEDRVPYLITSTLVIA